MAPYLDIVKLIERLHRHFLDVLRAEIRSKSIEDINAVQALLLYNIGNDEVAIRDLKDRGYYYGSNVSYNIKKLTEFGYLVQERNLHDRRSVRLKLTKKGIQLSEVIRELQEHMVSTIEEMPDMKSDLEFAERALFRMERAWTDYIRYGRS